MLLIADLEDKILIHTQAHHRGDAVGSIRPEVLFDVFSGEEFRILSQVDRITEVTVQVDDPGMTYLPDRSIVFGRGGNLELRHRSYPADSTIVDNHRRTRQRWSPCAIDEGKVS